MPLLPAPASPEPYPSARLPSASGADRPWDHLTRRWSAWTEEIHRSEVGDLNGPEWQNAGVEALLLQGQRAYLIRLPTSQLNNAILDQ